MWGLDKTKYEHKQSDHSTTSSTGAENVAPSLHSAPLYPASLITSEKQRYGSGSWDSTTSMTTVSTLSPNQQVVKAPQFMNPLLKTLEFLGVKSPSEPSAAQVSYRLTKLMNSERKFMKREQEYHISVASWATITGKKEIKELFDQFNKLVDIQIKSHEELIRKQEVINLQLNRIFQREHKLRTQREKMNTNDNKVKSGEIKEGESVKVSMAREHREEIQASINVIRSQIEKAICTSLKRSMVDYAIGLQNTSNRYKESCDSFFDFVNRDCYLISHISEPSSSIAGEVERINDDDKERLKDRTNTEPKDQLPNDKLRTRLHTSENSISDKSGTNCCPECMAPKKEGEITHASFCSHYRRIGIDGKPETQTLRSKLPLRIPSIMRQKDPAGIWG